MTKPGDAAIKAQLKVTPCTRCQAAEQGTLGQAIADRLVELAAVSDEPGALTRLYLGPAHRTAADLVAKWMREAGMTTRIDALGSVVGRYRGRDRGPLTLMLGSHIDTVRDAGRFDGALGVIMAIEVVKAAFKSGKRFPFAIEVVAFGDEEGVRFASTLGGSKALAGRFDFKALDEDRRRRHVAPPGVERVRHRSVCALSEEALSPEHALGYVEVHIEQGPVLEQEGLPVGIVTAIDGVTRGTVEVDGVAGHAGTVPMPMRKDALAAAAEMLLAIEARARSQSNLVATAGKIEVPGSAANTIPGRVRFTLDVRSPSDPGADQRGQRHQESHRGDRRAPRRDRKAYRRPRSAGRDSATVRFRISWRAVVEAMGIKPRRLPSGAGHDAMAFDKVIPFAMLFVRCRGGVSHNPAEFASPADIDVAARVLSAFLDGITPP